MPIFTAFCFSDIAKIEVLLSKLSLRTNKTDLGEEEIWSIYTMLTRIEDTFRSLKSELDLRPVYHRKEDRFDAHCHWPFKIPQVMDTRIPHP